MNATTFGAGTLIQKGPDSDDDDPETAFDEEETWNRKYVKQQSQIKVKKRQREEAKKAKLLDSSNK